MHRYPGPRSFTGDDRHLFFGRDAEKQELFRLIVLNDLVVLFGDSGTGKTSLLQAGVCPGLEEQQYKPVFIRLNNPDEAPETQVYQQLKAGGYIPDTMPEGRTLWEYFSRFWYVDLGEVFTPVIVFDQFEELFTLYQPEQRANFIEQFAAIANRRPPAGLSPEAATPPPAKFVFSLRSDFLYLLDELSADIPAILRCRFQLRLLDRSRASDAIIRPAAMRGDYISPSFGYSPAALEGILGSLSRASEGASTSEAVTLSHRLTTPGSGEIAAFQLQLVCRYLEDKIIRQQHPAGFSVSPDFYGGGEGIRQIIEDFYHQVIEKTAPAEREAVEKLLARGLIRNGRRIMMEASAMRDEYGVSQAALELLHDERLLKREARKGELYYEISHDTLMWPILKAEKVRELELLLENERNQVKEAAEKLKKRKEGEKKFHNMFGGVKISQFRYPGVRPFTTVEYNLFFGRSQEIKSITEKIFKEKIIILSGKSGVGKTSLINAGVVPEIWQSGILQPKSIRLGVYFADRDHLIQRFLRSIDISSVEDIRTSQENYVFLFDQFEEVFTFPVQELKGLLDVLKSLENHKVVFVLRDTALPHILAFGEEISIKTSEIIQLSPLSINNSLEAIQNPAELSADIFEGPAFEYSQDILDKISENAKNAGGQVDAFALQLFCSYIERKVIKTGRKIVSLEDVNFNVFYNYYEECLLRLPDEQRILARKIIEDNLIHQDTNGLIRRLNVALEVIRQEYGRSSQIEDILNFMDSNFLIRIEIRFGERYMEVSHDFLLPQIQFSLNERRIEQKRFEEMRAKELAIEAMRGRRRAWALAWLIGGVAVAAIGLAIFAFLKAQEAIIERNKSENFALAAPYLQGHVLPTDFSILSNFDSLSFAGWNIDTLPSKELGNLKHLQILNLSGNKLIFLPKNFEVLNNLRSLDLSYNRIETLPDKIDKFSNLEFLDLSSNNLIGLPKQIGSLKKLKYLDLSENKLWTLPTEIGNLESLQTLNLSRLGEGVYLVNLPSEIGKLKNLISLDFRNSALKYLPNTIINLKNLKVLVLSGSPMSEEYIANLRSAMPWCQIEF